MDVLNFKVMSPTMDGVEVIEHSRKMLLTTNESMLLSDKYSLNELGGSL